MPSFPGRLPLYQRPQPTRRISSILFFWPEKTIALSLTNHLKLRDKSVIRNRRKQIHLPYKNKWRVIPAICCKTSNPLIYPMYGFRGTKTCSWTLPPTPVSGAGIHQINHRLMWKYWNKGRFFLMHHLAVWGIPTLHTSNVTNNRIILCFVLMLISNFPVFCSNLLNG